MCPYSVRSTFPSASARIAEALGVTTSGDEAEDRQALTLASTNRWLVADGAEALDRRARDLLVRLEAATVLVTSREMLGNDGEHVVNVGPLDVPDGIAMLGTLAPRPLDDTTANMIVVRVDA